MIDTACENSSSIICRFAAKLAKISNRMLVLWCYFIWYLVMAVYFFDSNLSIWFTSLGISAFVGIALNLSTGGFTKHRIQNSTWEVIRLFLVPFCVSSFSALVKDKGFLLVIAPDPYINLKAVLTCFVFTSLVIVSRYLINSNWSKK